MNMKDDKTTTPPHIQKNRDRENRAEPKIQIKSKKIFKTK